MQRSKTLILNLKAFKKMKVDPSTISQNSYRLFNLPIKLSSNQLIETFGKLLNNYCLIIITIIYFAVCACLLVQREETGEEEQKILALVKFVGLNLIFFCDLVLN